MVLAFFLHNLKYGIISLLWEDDRYELCTATC